MASVGMADPATVEFSMVLPEGWQPGDPPFTFEGCRSALQTIRAALGLTRNGRMRSVLRSHDMWRMLTACVVGARDA